jgi:hypothetical protein
MQVLGHALTVPSVSGDFSDLSCSKYLLNVFHVQSICQGILVVSEEMVPEIGMC